MSFYLCTKYVMGIIADTKKYVDISISPRVRFPKRSTVIFDMFISSFEQLYLKSWFRNIFIEKLIKLWYIEKPMMIYSPRKSIWANTNKMLCAWVYRNASGHIYYDPTQIDDEQFKILNTKKFEIAIKLPDTIALAFITKYIDKILKEKKLLLVTILQQWNLSEQI
jgi:cell division protein FtsI/penicillin-binding protein 2